MKFELNGQDYQIRVQRREVVRADVMRHGEVVASGEAILNPADDFDPDKANNIAVGRALKTLPVGMDGHGRVQKEIVRRLQARVAWKQPEDYYAKLYNDAFLALSKPATQSIQLGGAYTTSDDLGNATRDYAYDGGKYIQSVLYNRPTTRWERFKVWVRRAKYRPEGVS